jgi:hypothetical protein
LHRGMEVMAQHRLRVAKNTSICCIGATDSSAVACNDQG